MKTNLLHLLMLVTITCTFFSACQKEASTSATNQGAVTAGSSNEALAKFCRLHSWQGLDDGYLRTLHYNNKGLMDSWHETAPLYDEDIFFTIEYGRFNTVAKIKYSDHDNFLYTIIPVYEFGRITEEKWYNGDTKTLYDDVVNTYNAFGRIVKRESIIYAYYAAFKYDILGNTTLELIKDAVSGVVYDSAVVQFKKPILEPMTAAPGMPYPIPFINYITSLLKYSAISEYGTDENGNVVKTYEQDNSKSVLKANLSHYAAYYDTYDKISGLENRQVWHYENCDCGNNDTATANSLITSVKHNSNLFMLYSTVPQIRERIMQMRKLKK